MRKKSLKWLILIIFIACFLRLYKLNSVPVSLFGDEWEVGYQAYSVLKTGRDYHGNFMPMHFESLAEWRTPIYLYSAIPTVGLFGITPLGVRLPAAIFGIITIPLIYLLVKEIFEDKKLGLTSALLLAISPWHVQYSRAGFEVTQLVMLLVLGVYSIVRAIKRDEKYLVLAGASFTLMPWVYSSAKLFSPLLMTLLVLVYLNNLVKFKKQVLLKTVAVCLVIGLPLVYNILFGGGSQRFSYVSVFSDPTTETEVGTARLLDGRARGETGDGLNPILIDRALHNKYVYWSNGIIGNLAQTFSSEFLFTKGDPNLRHSISGVGQFYVVESVVMIIGLIYLFTNKKIDRRVKFVLGGWIVLGAVPAAITREGGSHATRLILMLAPLLIIVSYGVSKLNKYLLVVYSGLFLVNFIFYQHNFWVHNPRNSARWWHYGWEQVIEGMKEVEGNYDKIVISTAGEPPWVFFAGAYEYDPASWQNNFPLENKTELAGFGEVSYISKYYFGSPKTDSYWEWNQVIDDKTLYVSDAREININLAREPERTPEGLNLIKSIMFPDGEPAFYIVSGK